MSPMTGRMLALLPRLSGKARLFRIDQLQHSLQAATRARRAGAPDETVFIALCHDLGKLWSWKEHARIGAELLRPHVSEQGYRLLLAHDSFRKRPFRRDRASAEKLQDDLRRSGCYELAREFALEWDYPSFDRSYASLPLEAFEPLLEAFLARPRLILPAP